MGQKTAIIIGAGPAGLTAAYELLQRTGIKPVVFEASSDIGGISKTVNYKGNRIDLGGHRFFSKSDRVIEWWLNIMPLQAEDPSPGDDLVMLVRDRLSRILFLRKLFAYPITLSLHTLVNLGPLRVTKIGLSYIAANLFPIKNEVSLEDFFINRFGKELYATFFRDYTEKVWGVPCSSIRPEWGAQRIKGLSISKAILHALKKAASKSSSIAQKNTETTLIERFMYPKYGPGQLWEEVARRIRQQGGEIHRGHRVVGIRSNGNTTAGVVVRNEKNGEESAMQCDYIFSSMPVKDLIRAWDKEVPEDVRSVADGLPYRDFITVGLMAKRLLLSEHDKKPEENSLIKDNWIYVQETDVKVGRLQIFNNWSPYMVKDPNTVWIGLEYFCNKGDDLWGKSDSQFLDFAMGEAGRIGIIAKDDIIDGVVLRMEKTYPAYFGSYEQFDRVRAFTDRYNNLFLIGRNGMHRYNNQDHSMLTAMAAVDNITKGILTKNNIWDVNTEEEYHEEK